MANGKWQMANTPPLYPKLCRKQDPNLPLARAQVASGALDLAELHLCEGDTDAQNE